MKRVLGLLFICVLCFVNAQTIEEVEKFEVELSELPHSSYGSYYTHIDNLHYLWNKGGDYYFIKQKPKAAVRVGKHKLTSNNSYVIAKVSSSGEELLNEFELKNGDRIFGFISVISGEDGSVFVLGEYNSKVNREYELCLFKLDRETNKIIEKKSLVSYEMYDETAKNFLSPIVSVSENKKRTLIASTRYIGLKKGKFIHDLIILDENARVLKQEKGSKEYSNVDDATINDNGDVFVVGLRFVGIKKGGQAFFYLFTKDGEKKSYKYEVPEGEYFNVNQDLAPESLQDWADASHCAISSNSRGGFHCAVSYISLLEGAGVGLISFDFTLEKFVTPNVNKGKYSQEMLDKFLILDSYKKIYKQLPNRFKVKMLNDGSRVVVGWYHLEYFTKSENPRLKFKGGNLVITKISADNEVLWNKFLARTTIGVSEEEWINVRVSKRDNDVVLHFNDKFSNDILSGKVTKKGGMKNVKEFAFKEIVIRPNGSFEQAVLDQELSDYKQTRIKMPDYSIEVDKEHLLMISHPYWKLNPLFTLYKYK